MNHPTKILATAVTAAILTTAAFDASATTNLIVNGSFSANTIGTTGSAIAGYTYANPPSDNYPVAIIGYSNGDSYPYGAFGEGIGARDAADSASPDPVGSTATYFVSNTSNNESLSQSTLLNAGAYEVGFEYLLPSNGEANPGKITFTAEIGGVTVASFDTATQSVGADTWYYVSAVADIQTSGLYTTSFDFTALSGATDLAAKDVVIDQIYIISTRLPPTVTIPSDPTAPAPEPAAWTLMIVGLGGMGAALRTRRNRARASMAA